MENTHPLLNVTGKARLGSYASFPGSGPHGSKCCQCSHQAPDGNRFICEKYRVMTSRKGSPIDPGSPGCRYFEQRPAFSAMR